MGESDKIKFGIVGCGHIGRRHAEMVLRNTETELVGLCDIRDEEELGLRDFDAPFYQIYADLLASKPDIISICTPNGLHAEQGLA
ncbi:MAG: Gfo/Idh/MocA family oxidoreductase, partial [Flavobacteriales bacterium]|nr:Gfo/Idh/MocA family oxidoreductase [Flavobacteriales bacterium]